VSFGAAPSYRIELDCVEAVLATIAVDQREDVRDRFVGGSRPGRTRNRRCLSRAGRAASEHPEEENPA
jgi:hypothetical protein